MFDLDVLLTSLGSVLSDPDVITRTDEVRGSLQGSCGTVEYEDVWFCHQIAPEGLDAPQYLAACDFFGIEYDSYEDQMEQAWDEIDRKASSLADALNTILASDMSPGHQFSIGHWETGCYGVILGYSCSNDDHNFHTVRFASEDWRELQRLNWALDDARTAARAAALGNHAARAPGRHETFLHTNTGHNGGIPCLN